MKRFIRISFGKVFFILACGGLFFYSSNTWGMSVFNPPVCGDGVLDAGETCDDQNTTAGDGCSSACAVEQGWSCANPNGNNLPSVCSPICGDGLLKGAEACDDGNTAAGDGCSLVCQVEEGWSCAGEPSACTPICGDGLLKGGEVCDSVSGDTECCHSCQADSGAVCNAGAGLCNSSGECIAAIPATTTLSISDAVISPTEDGNLKATLFVTISSAGSQVIHVEFCTQDGTAKAGIDYAATCGSLDFNPGEISKEITMSLMMNTPQAAGGFLSFVVRVTQADISIADGEGIVTYQGLSSEIFGGGTGCAIGIATSQNVPRIGANALTLFFSLGGIFLFAKAAYGKCDSSLKKLNR